MFNWELLHEKAYSYIGTQEKPVNDVIFNTDYYGHKVNGKSYPWCCAFVWDMFRLSGNSLYFYGGGRTASCTTLMNYYLKFHKNWCVPPKFAKRGDIIFFNFDGNTSNVEHIGIVSSSVGIGSGLITIEGNTSSGASGSQSDGDGVWLRMRTNKKQLFLAIHPTDNTFIDNGEILAYNVKVKKESVQWLQFELNKRGYALEIDGYFGNLTRQAVIDFQAKNNLETDSKVGEITRYYLYERG